VAGAGERLVAHGGFDLILSIGQVVPHEVIGMANYNKNILVGTGGRESITAAIIWALFMGWSASWAALRIRAQRSQLRFDRFFARFSIVYVLTVIGRADDGLAVRGLFIGDDVECSPSGRVKLESELRDHGHSDPEGCRLSRSARIHSTWLGNKAIYRTRMALATMQS